MSRKEEDRDILVRVGRENVPKRARIELMHENRPRAFPVHFYTFSPKKVKDGLVHQGIRLVEVGTSYISC